MNKTIVIESAVIVLVAVVTIFFVYKSARQETPTVGQKTQEAGNQTKWEAKTDDQASVAVVVTPLDLSPVSQEWKFAVVMDTHSVELNHDMVASAILVDDQGKEYAALRWEGASEGHHREGLLMFNKMTPTPQVLKLKISNIGSVVRIFSWKF